MTCQLLLSLSLLVLIHEFGHFIAARSFGIRVSKFYIFFNPTFSLVRFKKVNGKWQFKFFAKNLETLEIEKDIYGQPILDEKGRHIYKTINTNLLPDDDWRKYPENTEYGIGWLPLGGYVKIAGMIDESMDTASLKEEPKDWEFRSKPAWQRFVIMVAGVVMNVIAGVLILTFSHLSFTKEYLPVQNVPEGIYAYPYARYLGFENGDKIIAINGKPVERYEDVFSTKLYFANEVTVDRSGTVHNIEMPDTIYSYLRKGGALISMENHSFIVDSVLPESPAYNAGIRKGAKILYINGENIRSYGQMREILMYSKNDNLKFVVDNKMSYDTLDVHIDNSGKIGIYTSHPVYELKKYDFASAMKYGWNDAFEAVHSNIKGFGLIFSGKESARENLSGPIGIAKAYGGVWNWERFWKLTGIISMILAFVNILPIPALDGGHALFLFIEAITRRKLSDKFMEVVQIIGMIILFGLMIFIIGNDIINLF